MRGIVRRTMLTVLLIYMGMSVFALNASAASAVKNVTVKKSGKYYLGYDENGKLLRWQWGEQESEEQIDRFYFDGKGRAYTGVGAVGKTPGNTKLYFFNMEGKLISDKTSKLQKLSRPGKEVTALKQFIRSIDKAAKCKTETACGMTMLVYSNRFTVYTDTRNTKLVGYILADR